MTEKETYGWNWIDADRAGRPGRKSAIGRALLLKGAFGTQVLHDRASREQLAVARPSGEAETVALDDALGRVAGANKGLCAAGISALGFFEKIFGAKLLLVFVDASARKAAAEKGLSSHVKYISRTQGVDLFWPRDIVQRLGECLEKVESAFSVVGILTKPFNGSRTWDLRHSLGVVGAFDSTNGCLLCLIPPFLRCPKGASK